MCDFEVRGISPCRNCGCTYAEVKQYEKDPQETSIGGALEKKESKDVLVQFEVSRCYSRIHKTLELVRRR